MQGGGNSQGNGSSSDGSPLDQQGSQPSAREPTPDKPGGQQSKPDGQGEKPTPSNQQGGQPNSPRDSTAQPENHESGLPPRAATAKGDAAQSNERWGDLPLQVRELFRTEGGGEMPVQYRDWIDAYYRRLNQRP